MYDKTEIRIPQYPWLFLPSRWWAPRFPSRLHCRSRGTSSHTKNLSNQLSTEILFALLLNIILIRLNLRLGELDVKVRDIHLGLHYRDERCLDLLAEDCLPVRLFEEWVLLDLFSALGAQSVLNLLLEETLQQGLQFGGTEGRDVRVAELYFIKEFIPTL